MATYYISTTGNDSTGTGAILNPWRTIAKLLSTLVAGDVGYLRGGTYVERINSNTQTIGAGTSFANAVTLSGYPGETAIVSPTGGGDVFNLVSVNVHYIIFTNFTVEAINITSGEIFSIGSGTHHVRIDNCELKNGWNIGVFCAAATGAGIEILNSNIHNNGRDGQGTSIYLEAGGVLVSGNLLHDNTGFGMQADDSHSSASSDNNIIIGNRIYNNTGPIQFGMAFDGSNNLIANNIIYGNPGEGISLGYGNTVSNANKIYNNTIFSDVRCINIGAFNTPTNTLVKNNICRTESNGTGTITNAGTGTVLSNNITSSDPLFVNFSSKDLHITSSSPARDAGVNLSPDVVIDFDGNSRPQGGSYDIGAYEFIIGGPAILNPSPIPTDDISSNWNEGTKIGTMPASDTFDGTGTLNSPPWVQMLRNSNATLSRSGNQVRGDI